MNYPEKLIIGLMSGTSLDGLDIVLCKFFSNNMGEIKFEVIKSTTIGYDSSQKESLSGLIDSSAVKFAEQDFAFGYFMGDAVRSFLEEDLLTADLVASHGHTVFHQPEKGFTAQIGNGACIAARTGLPVVYDFRALDVALGGQGAPLVPVGDKLLFSEFTHCLNLGGIANISFDNSRGDRVAFDICPVNMVLNYLSLKAGVSYDEGGKIAQRGKLCDQLLQKLENLDFYKVKGPKSLGKEWVDKTVIPILEDFKISVEDKLHTYCNHVAKRITEEVSGKGESSLLITGGGALNTFLIERVRQEVGANTKVIVPEKETVLFKEAIIFAFLGYLRMLNINNSLASVTGAKNDSCGGALTGFCF